MRAARLLWVLLANALSLSSAQQYLLYINGEVRSEAYSYGWAGSGVGDLSAGGVGGSAHAHASSFLTKIGEGFYTWMTATAFATGSGSWPEYPSYWTGNGSFSSRSEGVRQILVTGTSLSTTNAPRIEKNILSYFLAYAYAGYLNGARGRVACGNTHHGTYEITIPFRVSMNTPAVLAVGQSTNYGMSAGAAYMEIILEEMPPITIATVERYDPISARWEPVGSVSYRARMPDGSQGRGSYTDLSPGLISRTVFLEAGAQYRLSIWHSAYATFASWVGDAPHLLQNAGGGVGSAIVLILNRLSIPPTLALDDIRADINANGVVDDSDLLHVLLAYGASGSSLPADVNNDGVVDDGDLLSILIRYGLSY